ncbi:MAG: EAL domain-containing protein [Bacillota bacterium]
MTEFFKTQVDYIIFLEGLAYLAFGVICHFILDKEKDRGLPWGWLGWFGITHGVSDWIEIFVLTLPNPTISLVRESMLALSFVFLLEFARIGSARQRGSKPGLWLYAPLILLAAAGGMYSWQWFNYTIGFIIIPLGGLWSAYIVFMAFKLEGEKRPSILLLSVALGTYTAVSFADFWVPDTFSGPGIVLQVLHYLFALCANLAVLSIIRTAYIYDVNSVGKGRQALDRLLIVSSMVCMALLIMGWTLTDKLGKVAESELEQNLLSDALMASSAINPQRVERLSGSPSDIEKPDFEFLRSQLITIQTANPRFRFVYLFRLVDGKVVFLVDAEPEHSEDYSPPGQIYDEASEQLLASFSDGQPFIEGPLTDRWGTWVSGLAPVRNNEDGKIVAVLGMDVSAEDWPFKISAYRLASISGILILFLALLFFSAMYFNKDIAKKSISSEKRFRAIFESAAEGIFIFEVATCKILKVNPFVVKWLGYQYSEIVGKNIDSLFGTLMQDIQEKNTAADDEHDFGQIKEGQCRKKDGSLVDVTVTGTTLNFQGKDCILMFTRDVTRRNLAREAFHIQTTALESAANSIIITEREGQIVYVNPAFNRYTGFSREEAVGLTPSVLKSGSQGRDFYKKLWDTIISGQVWYGEVINRRKDGSLYTVEMTITPVYNKHSEITHFIAIQQDVTDRKRVEDQLRYLATHDSLTNIPNRYYLEEALKRAIAKARRGKKSALIFIDLDNFKLVNDTMGHDAGDQLLVALIEILKNNLREEDLLARLGGDEFAVLLDVDSADDAMGVANKLRSAVDEDEFCLISHETCFNISISAGVVMVDGTLDPLKLLSYADTALYKAKEGGRNRVVFVQTDEDATAWLSEANQLIALIKSALKENLFVIYFQPVFDVKAGKVAHHEALLRLSARNGEIISPEAFIPVAERFGLMPQIDRWVVENAIGALHKYPELNLFVNLSGLSLGDEELLSYIEAHIRQSGINPSRIGFEITETTAVKDLVRAERWIRKLKNSGCRFALDDFGIGFSSFSYLRILPVDYLKIDGTFVQSLDKDFTYRALVQAMSTVASALGKMTVAEYVENEDILTILRDLEIDYAQGFFLGKPSPEPVS